MTLASQTSGALLAVGKKDTTLLLDIDGSFSFGLLGLGFVFLLFLLGLFVFLVIVGFSLLSFISSARTSGQWSRKPTFAVTYVVLLFVVVVTFLSLLFGSLRSFSGLFLLPCLLLFGLQATRNMFFRSSFQDNFLAMLADDGLERLLFAIWEVGHSLFVELRHDG